MSEDTTFFADEETTYYKAAAESYDSLGDLEMELGDRAIGKNRFTLAGLRDGATGKWWPLVEFFEWKTGKTRTFVISAPGSTEPAAFETAELAVEMAAAWIEASLAKDGLVREEL